MTATPSHPPSILHAARSLIRERHLLDPGSRVLVAVSGGPDSQATLSVLARLSDELNIRVYACGIDHGLRPEARRELQLAMTLASRYGVPMNITTIHLESGGNLMARARDARFEALHSVANELGCDRLALGHHADDRAETVLLRMLRGAGPKGLAAMPARSGSKIRPLLTVRRDAILRYLERQDIPFALDPSNRSPRFLRVRVRREVLPLLEQLSPNIVKHLCDLAEDLERRPDHSDDYRPLGRAHLQALARAINTGNKQARISLPRGFVARLSEDETALELAPPSEHRGSRPPKHPSPR